MSHFVLWVLSAHTILYSGEETAEVCCSALVYLTLLLLSVILHDGFTAYWILCKCKITEKGNNKLHSCRI